MNMKIDEITIRHSPTISQIDEKVGSLICDNSTYCGNETVIPNMGESIS
jgi:hypothetical protein